MKIDTTLLEKYTFLTGTYPFLQNKNPAGFTSDQKRYIDVLYDAAYHNKPLSTKKEERLRLKKMRAAYDPLELEKKSAPLADRVIESSFFKKACTVFCYISYNNEIDTKKIIDTILKTNKQLAVPVVQGTEMIAAGVDCLDNFINNKYGIPEPAVFTPLSKEEIDLVITPAFGFNPFGFRIGYGGGFYDKFLAGFPGISLGIVLRDFLLFDFVPSAHDIPVDCLIIE